MSDVTKASDPPQAFTPIAAVHQSPAKAWVENAQGVQSIVTTLGLLVAAWWALRGDFPKSRSEREQERSLRERENQQRVDTLEQRKRQLRWDQARVAREINEAFLDDLEVQVVLGVLDGDVGVLEARDKDGESYTFDLKKREDVLALSARDEMLDKKSVFLRDCFDAWFYRMSLMEQHLEIGLIKQEDIDYPSAYYIRCLKADPELLAACDTYIANYGLGPRVNKFLARF